LEGKFYKDTLRIGAPGKSQIVIKNQPFGNAEKQNNIFTGGFEAIIGLSYPNLAAPGITPVFDSMMQQHLVKSNLFAFYLTAKNDGVESDITFGYYDTSKFTGKIVWHPVLDKEFFIIKLDDLKVGGKSLGLCGKNGLMKKDCLVTVDSGTSTFSASGSFFKHLPKLGVATHTNPVDCTNVSEKKLTYVINGHDYDIEPLDYLVGPVTRGEAANVQPYL